MRARPPGRSGRPAVTGLYGGDLRRPEGDLLLEQLVEPAVRHLPLGTGEPVDLVLELGIGQQPVGAARGVRRGRHLLQCRHVVARDAVARFGVQHVGAVAQE
ncbi:hypothetical protein ACLF6K_13045 [Streptomyces xanthophaeus]|uniref:hypothetical protein n=1 Tax=Streptomyces xanthophaeus TaxID=67385 RepID=UPI003990278C